MKKNTIKQSNVKTYEGGKASKINFLQELERTVCCCLLWEDNFYEDGISITERIQDLINKVDNQDVISLIKKTKFDMKLRHIPLFMIACLLKKGQTGLKDLIAEICTRPDDMGELLALYQTENNALSNSIKKGLAEAFTKFSEYQLAKYNRNNSEYKLVDIANLVHPKSTEAIDKLMKGTLKTPDTWEVFLSKAGSDKEKKKEAWLKLIKEDKLLDMAFLKNIAGIRKAGIDDKIIKERIKKITLDKLLPIDYIRAGIMNPEFENEIEESFLQNMANTKKELTGKTLILVDVSASMDWNNSSFSNLDYANSIAMIGRELCEDVIIYTFSTEEKLVPNRRGFALGTAIKESQCHSGTFLGMSLENINKKEKYDRLIVITDEQTSDKLPNPLNEKSYIINVSNCQRGVGYEQGYKHISGFSDSIFDYIKEIEKL